MNKSHVILLIKAFCSGTEHVCVKELFDGLCSMNISEEDARHFIRLFKSVPFDSVERGNLECKALKEFNSLCNKANF